MVRWLVVSAVIVGGLLVAACAPFASETNPYLTLTETFGPSGGDNANDNSGGGGGSPIEEAFRREMVLTFANNNPDATLNVAVIAWVNSGSIRSAEQQDALLRGGYVQLTRETPIGTVFSLPPGTFVLNGPGAAGATAIRLPAAEAAVTTQDLTIITPDVVLAYAQPPTSCDSVAFFYTIEGAPIDSPLVPGGLGLFGGATGGGGAKTLAQVDVYQCDPLRPGLFLKLGGGARLPNEFFEGENVRFDFLDAPTPDGAFATVTIQ